MPRRAWKAIRAPGSLKGNGATNEVYHLRDLTPSSADP
jgi:hypothetical protein